MNIRKISNFLFTLTICLMMTLLVRVDDVNASGATEGAEVGGGSCSSVENKNIDWWDTCFGFSWQKYEVTADLPNKGASFYYTDNTNPKGAVNIKGCKKGQFIYNYGLEVYNSGKSTGYQVSTQKYKYGVQAKHASSAKGAYYPSSEKTTIDSYTKVTGYATTNEVQAAFNDMMEYVQSHDDVPFSGDKNMEWGDVGAFCYSPEASEPVFYSWSRVKIGDRSFHGTNIVKASDSDEDKKASDSVEIMVGESVSLVFAHNIYSSKSASGVPWKVTRTMKKGTTTYNGFPAGKGYNITPNTVDGRSNGGTSSPASGTVNMSNRVRTSEPKYSVASRPYSGTNGDTNRYFHRDEYTTVKFTSSGTYTFCERVSLDNVNITSSCAKITVKPLDYYSSSHAKATGVDGVSTNIKKSSSTVTTVTTDAVDLTVGDTLEEMVFQHYFYASGKATNVSWSITSTGFVGAGVQYDIGNEEHKQSRTSGTVDMTTDYPSGVNAKYRPSTYPYYTSKYKNIKFNTSGTYVFCEQVSLNGNAITQSCVEVRVKSMELGAKSNVSNRPVSLGVDGDEGDYAFTDVYPLFGNNRYASTNTLKIDVGGSASITFSHNLYATRETNNVEWKIIREVAGTSDGGNNGFDSGDYSISYSENNGLLKSANSSAAEATGVANIREANSGIFIADTDSRRYTDGGAQYVHRDFYTITFNKEGTYRFCENVYIRGVLYTFACSTIEVGGGGDDPGECADISWFNAESGVTSVTSAVKNTTNGTGWQSEVYAKPNDDIEWLHCYYPGVQSKAYEMVTRYHYEHDTNQSSGEHSNTNMPISSFGIWDNKFTVEAIGGNFESNNGIGEETKSFGIGDKNTKSLADSYKVLTGKAGQTLTEKITSGSPTSVTITNDGDHSWQCDPYTSGGVVRYRTCTHGNDYIESNRFDSYNTASASVNVPYNFINTASINVDGMNVYAGEAISISGIEIKTDKKYNSVTNGTYATRVDDASIQVIGYLSDVDDSERGSMVELGGGASINLCSVVAMGSSECAEYSGDESIVLNGSENLEGDITRIDIESVAVPDVEAGKFICFVAGVYPYSSGEDTQMSTSGDNTWYISEPSCKKVAKRPSFQVWGGGISARGRIITSVADKSKLNINGIMTDIDGIVSFGSWVEQESRTTGLTTLLATGAATGDNGNTIGGVKVGGSRESQSDFCRHRVPLSLANYSFGSSVICPQDSTKVGYSGVSVNTEKDDLIEYLLSDANMSGVEVYSDDSTIRLNENYSVVSGPDGEELRYTYGERDLYIGVPGQDEILNEATTHVIKVEDDVAIMSNLKYQESSYHNLLSIPKLVIYAENIYVDCAVTRIDAILIADDDIVTCLYEDEDVDLSINSQQLTINGIIIAGKLDLTRTYGAATGVNSGVPAEIINYDASTILWGQGIADNNSQSSLNSVYQREIAPRY